jgi:hypothetical protein
LVQPRTTLKWRTATKTMGIILKVNSESCFKRQTSDKTYQE